MSTCHFVYAGDPNNDRQCSPYNITRNVYRTLTKMFDRVLYADWCHTGPLEPVQPGDVIIGHPNYPSNTPIRRLFEQKARAKILLFPFHSAMAEINWPFNDLAMKADAILSITGQYWYDTIESTAFAKWKPKMTRLDMAIDASQFPCVKTSFNPSGQRQFLYIGCDRPEKGVDRLCEIIRRSPYILHIFGNVDSAHPIAQLPNVRLGGWADIDVNWARAICTKVDAFLNASVSDANPTTLLEAACWGLPVACSPQSGYYGGRLFHSLNLDDYDGCAHLLHVLNHMSEADMLAKAAATRQIVATEHTWDRFCQTITDAVKKFI